MDINTEPKSIEMKIINNKIHLQFIGEPIPPVKKALKENGFKNKNGVYSAEINTCNKFLIKLLTGVVI